MTQITPAQLERQLATIITDREFIKRAVADYASQWQPEPEPVVEIIPPEERNRTSEEIHLEEMQQGSSLLLNAMDNARRGKPTHTKGRLIWRHAAYVGESRYGEYRPKVPPVNPPVRMACVGCGVRYDVHAEFGCKRWRA